MAIKLDEDLYLTALNYFSKKCGFDSALEAIDHPRIFTKIESKAKLVTIAIMEEEALKRAKNPRQRGRREDTY